MNLQFDTNLISNYKSNSQIARIITENWTSREIFCPNCGKEIKKYPDNKPVADFYCEKCIEDFEQKSKEGKFGKKVPAGQYNEFIKRVNSEDKPNFFFMGRNKLVSVNEFFAIPKYFFVPEIIEKRKPLAKTARRAGWIGSNILFYKIPKDGQIYYVKNGIEVDKNEVIKNWQKTTFLNQVKKAEAKGWILDIMNCLDDLDKNEFTLDEVYQYEKVLQKIHPENKNIKPKIRQQLQFLRNKGYLGFMGHGKYKRK